jgi:hypothetical protein
MAQQFVTDSGTLIIPSAKASWRVATESAGLSTSGVIMLVGEAESGPSFDLEDKLSDNAFGPDQAGAVRAKYTSGPLVDAFAVAAAAANDPAIVGAPSRIVCVKTNRGARATATLQKHDGSDYHILADKSYGKTGNLIYFQVENKVAEVPPTTSSFTWIPNVGTVDFTFHVNGGEAQSLRLSADTSPSALVAAVNGLVADLASGGAEKVVLPATGGGKTLAMTVNGYVATINIAGATYALTLTAGDTLVIPSGSILAGAADANVGAYVVTSATTGSIVCTKLSDAGKGGATPGTITAPAAVIAAEYAVGSILAYAPVSMTVSSTILPGVGKSLEIAQLDTGTDLIERCLFTLNTTPVSWLSKTGAAKVLLSAAEHAAKITITRQSDGVQEELSAGGEIALKLSYQGSTAQAVINDTTMTITVTGGTGTSIGALTLSDFPTLADLAAFINSKTGYKCAVGSGILGQLSPVYLDDGTFTFASTFGEYTGRLKVDGYKFFKKISDESVLVRLQNSSGTVEQAAAGLPAVQAITFLSGGTKGATTQANVVAAIDALEKVQGNFLVPLFSRDAAEDIVDGLTDSGSTYTIDAINAYCRTHVLRMSTLKKQRNRQAFISKRATFAAQKEAAANIASFRCSMTFQDCKNLDSTGNIKQFQPWMHAVVAAGMQAAAFYKAIVNKVANISGAVHHLKEFDDQDDTNVEDALLAGLLPIRRLESGGWAWVSDQTTYGKDSNFVFNSIQACYVADLIALTTSQKMERAFVGQSVADVSAPVALSFLEAVLLDFLRLKLIAPSEDAPRGYRNVSIRISGTSMVVSLEVKLAGAIYFIPISFLVSQVQQSA